MMPWIGVLPVLPALWLAAGDSVDGAGATTNTVDVRSVGIQCPSPADVAQRIRPLLPAGTGFQSSDWIELAEVPSRRPGTVDVEVRLERAGAAAPLGVRRIERAGRCDEVADAVAVVAATWITEFTLPAPAVPALPAPDAGAGAPPQPTPAPRSGPSVAASVASPAPPEAPSANAFALGGFGGALTGGSGGPTGLFGLEGELRRRVLLARFAVSATGARELSLTTGRASWQRIVATAAVGADLWRGQRAFVDATLGPMLGVITARGIGLDMSTAATGLDVGIAPGLRVGRSLLRDGVLGWVAVGGALWLRDRILAVDGDAETRTLPRFEAEISAGLTFFLGS